MRMPRQCAGIRGSLRVGGDNRYSTTRCAPTATRQPAPTSMTQPLVAVFAMFFLGEKIEISLQLGSTRYDRHSVLESRQTDRRRARAVHAPRRRLWAKIRVRGKRPHPVAQDAACVVPRAEKDAQAALRRSRPLHAQRPIQAVGGPGFSGAARELADLRPSVVHMLEVES